MSSEDPQPTPPAQPAAAETRPVRRRSRWRRFAVVLLAVVVVLGVVRLFLPGIVHWYVNRVLDQAEVYRGEIGDVSLHLWRGAYTIHDIRINKATGNVPVPFFAAKRLHLALEWPALLHGKLVGRVSMEGAEMNFVDARDQASAQTGAGGPWLDMLRKLFPFQINSVRVTDSTITFRAFHTNPPVDVHISQLEGEITDLTNVQDQVTPMIATVKASGLVMDDAKIDYEMKLDPFSYRPTFQMATRMLGLNVTKLNSLARAYGDFDYEGGWLDLVVELNVTEGRVEGYIKPLFRNLRVFALRDLTEGNPLLAFWEALVGLVTTVFKNQPHDQLGTVIPVRGDLSAVHSDILATLGNLLRNAFVRAYLPRLQGTATQIDGLAFGPASLLDTHPEPVKPRKPK